MAGWRLANSLVVLRDQVNKAAPNRNKASDGTIGNAAHAARASDHNPNAQGVVCALDITHDPAGGMDAHGLAEMLRARRHPNLKYIISNRRIAGEWNGWNWEDYGGPNPHTSHIHISVGIGPDGKTSDGTYDDTTGWAVGQPANPTPTPAPAPPPAPKPQPKEYVQLPGHVHSWAAYNENGPYSKASGKYVILRPSKFNGLPGGKRGLEYQVLGRKANGSAVVISTQMFGRRTIWVAGTSARIVVR